MEKLSARILDNEASEDFVHGPRRREAARLGRLGSSLGDLSRRREVRRLLPRMLPQRAFRGLLAKWLILFAPQAGCEQGPTG
jgi:hypothetical protein